MLQGLRDTLETAERRRVAPTRRLDDVLDKLNAAIRTFLTGLDPDAMTDADHGRVAEILAFATNMEHAGDVVERNLLGIAAKAIKRGVGFSGEGRAELLAAVDRLLVNLRTAASLLVTEDVRTARLLAAEKEVFRDIETRATGAHLRPAALRAWGRGGKRCAAPGRASRLDQGERPSGGGGGISGPGGERRIAAEPAAAR